MIKKILLTRPRAASERWAAALAAQGFTCVIEPLLQIAPADAPRPHGAFQAVIFTSANAPDSLATRREECADLLALPCFCVGSATGAAARILGFADIHCGASDGAALARAMTATLTDKTRPLLHITGDTTTGAVAQILAEAGFTVMTWPVYTATAADSLSADTLALLAAGDIAAVVVFSPRSAQILATLIEKNQLTAACQGLIAIGLSQAVADVLESLPWQRIRVAATPGENAALDCLKTEFIMPPPQASPPDAAPAAIARRGKGGGVWIALAVVLLSSAGTVALNQCPWLRSLTPVAENPQTTRHINDLERRISALEQQRDAQKSTAALPDPDPEIASLADSVKNLQTQVAQVQAADADSAEAAQKAVAAAFALWDLRQAIDRGDPFAAPLAAFDTASANAGHGADISAPTAILFLHTAGVPTLAQLGAELAAHEPDSAAPDGTPTIAEKIKRLLRPFISVHALHQPSFAALESALAAGDAAGAQAAFASLSQTAQHNLSAWRDRLQARIDVDAALRDLAAHFMPASGQGNKT